MNILDINFAKDIPNIIDAFAQIYGQEFKDVITKRINKIQYVIYNNADGINAYYHFLLVCKRRELALSFLEQIGLDISEYNGKSYTQQFDYKTNMLLSSFVDASNWELDSEFPYEPIGINAFDDRKRNVEKEIIISEQLKFLNFYRGYDENPLTYKNLEEFKKTEEYSIILNEIKSFIKIQNNLLAEYKEYVETLKEFKDYDITESQRQSTVLLSKRKELYKLIESDLPVDIKEILDDITNDYELKAQILCSDNLISNKLCIEYFSKVDNDNLNNPDIDESNKQWIIYQRLNFFQSLGLNIMPWKEIGNYNNFIQREDIKKLIPSTEFVKEFTKIREEKLKEANIEIILGNKNSNKTMSNLINNFSNLTEIYSTMKNKNICLLNGKNKSGEFIPMLFYTVTNGTCGKLDYVFLHELTHAIESKGYEENKYRTGFDYIDRACSLNPYTSTKRKYEIMNETITDIIAIETRSYLHKKGLYFAEKPSHTIYDVNDYNTNKILKNMVTPLLQKFHSSVIEARLFGRFEELYSIIGEENYEALNDALNKVHYLLDKGLLEKFKEKNSEDQVVTEYYSQLEKLEQIYHNMDMFASKEIPSMKK